MVTLASPVYGDGQFLGSVAMDFKFSAFSDFLALIKIKSGTFSLLSSTNELLAQKDFDANRFVIEKDKLVPADLSEMTNPS